MSENPVKSTRCAFPACKKKVGLLGFACKCEKTYCSGHRQAEMHLCRFDYLAESKTNLLKHMSTAVTAPKVEVL